MDTFGIISAYIPTASLETNQIRLDDLKEDLRALGYSTSEVKGSWKGAPERSLLVYNIKFTQIRELGQKYGQEAVVYNDSLVSLIPKPPRPVSLSLSQRLASTVAVANAWLTSQDSE